MIDAEQLNRVGISYEAGMKRFMDDAALYEAVLRAFVGEDVVERSRQAYEARDCHQLLMAVHEMKGASGNAGFDDLYRVSSELVALLRTDGFSERELSEQYQRYMSTCEKMLKGIIAALSDGTKTLG